MWLTAFMLALGLSWAQAQESGLGEVAEKRNAISVFVGALSNLDTNETGAAVGVDYTREVSEKLGIVGLAEWANAGGREAAFGGGIEWKLGGGFKLLFAPGLIVEKTDDDETSDEDGDSGGSSRETLFFFRTGISYEFEVSNIPLTPKFYFDTVDSEVGVDVHLVYGMAISISF